MSDTKEHEYRCKGCGAINECILQTNDMWTYPKRLFCVASGKMAEWERKK